MWALGKLSRRGARVTLWDHGQVPRWRCPACDREFSRANQSHVCVPGNTVDESFAGRPPVQREIYEAIIGYLRTLGPVCVDAVRVGVFLSHVDKVAEVRPKVRSVGLWLMMPRELDDPRIGRRDRVSTGRVAHYLTLTSVSDVDNQLCDWLGEAYDAAG
jgi:Domain of unknown function (DUF5655)